MRKWKQEKDSKVKSQTQIRKKMPCLQRNKKRFTAKCYHCWKYGHIEKDCCEKYGYPSEKKDKRDNEAAVKEPQGNDEKKFDDYIQHLL